MKLDKKQEATLKGAGSVLVAEESEAKQMPSAARTGVATDPVELFSLEAKLQAAQDDSPERAVLLERLSSEVASGRYEVDAQKVSKSIVDETLKEKL